MNLDEIPVAALKPATMGRLGCMLNARKILPSPEPLRLPRDYRGIAHLMGISTIYGSLGEKPIEKLLLELGPDQHLTLGRLQSYFEKIDRYDVLDDTKQMFHDDAVEFEDKKRRIVVHKPYSIHKSFNSGLRTLTIDDAENVRNGKGLQIYDAFLLYVDSDRDFAENIMHEMEKKFDLKVCDSDRDLLPGLTFQHAAIMQLISERCKKLFVILSDEFFGSDRHTFFVKFAQAITYETGYSKVIPCTYKSCNLPIEYSCYVRVDYQRDIANGYFWKKLQNSICPAEDTEGVRIEEIKLEDEDSKKIDLLKNAEICAEQNNLKSTSQVKPNEKSEENNVLPKTSNLVKCTEKKSASVSITKKIRKVFSKNQKSKKKQLVYAS